MADERTPPAEGAEGVPLQPPRQGDIDTPGVAVPAGGQPPAEEQARRAARADRERRGNAPPRYDHMGRLTRHGMELAVKEGGSVMLPPTGPLTEPARIVTHLDDLPSEDDLHAAADARAALMAAQMNRQAAGPTAELESAHHELIGAHEQLRRQSADDRKRLEQAERELAELKRQQQERDQRQEAERRQQDAQRQEQERAEQQRQEAERAEAERQKRKGK